MEANAVSVAIAFAAGIVSFLSPCVLPLVPSYLSYIAGTAARGYRVAFAAIGFVLGLSLVFALLGATASLVGQTVLANKLFLSKIAGATIVFLGLNLLGVVRLLPLFRHYRLAKLEKIQGGIFTSVIVGASFGITWTPCVGLTLGAIFLLAAQEATALQGAFLLFVFGLGLGLPFILAGLALDRFTAVRTALNPHLEKIEKASGLALIILGILVFTDSFFLINAWLIGKLGTGLVR